MPQYGALVYLPVPADPMEFTPAYLEQIDRYPERAKEFGGKILGGSYFSGQRGFAFESSSTATAISGDVMRMGPLVESDLVAAAFFVISAPNMDTAVRIAGLHPAAHDGGVEVRPLLASPTK